MVTTSSGEQTSKSTCLPSPADSVASGEPVKGGFLNTGLESSCNFNNRFLWARPNCLWHLTETCLGRIKQCPVDSALPSGVFGCEHEPCCSAGTGAWLMSYPSAAAGKSLLINSFSKDNRLPLKGRFICGKCFNVWLYSIWHKLPTQSNWTVGWSINAGCSPSYCFEDIR